MKFIPFVVLLAFVFVVLSCNNRSVQSSKYFDYDGIDYYFNDFDEDEIELLDNPKTELDTIKNRVILGDIPLSMNDLSFVNKLEKIGYRRTEIDESKFPEIDKIFGRGEQDATTSCIYVYRDILVFKKKDKVVGVVKICFDCFENQIVGGLQDSAYFNRDVDYNRLKNLLRGKGK
ncbi:hypothetical protein [Polluticoccus soli]|uniref:hypothetical protein n=1 Tax=Polluticoccus soli TaxID=3034150 RepID=UPI0023E0EAA8|nr:hypothetical protein [Flavipsychrobacter sp. JY13-12]